MAIKRYIGLGKETTYGTAVAATRYAEAIASIKPDQNWVISPPISSRIFRKRNLGLYRTRGTIGDFDIEPQNIIGELLYGTFGSLNTTNPAVGVYNHVFQMADSLPSYTMRIGSEQTERILPGCLINSLRLKFPHDGNLKCNAEILSGFEETKGSLATPTLSNLQPFNFSAYPALTLLTIGGVNKKDIVYDVEVNFRNNIPFSRGDLSGRTFSKKRYGQFEATGKLSAYFDDTTEYDRFMAGTPFDLIIHCVGPPISGGYCYLILAELKNCVYLSNVAPDIIAMNEPLVVDAEFKAFAPTGGDYEEEVVLQNTITSY